MYIYICITGIESSSAVKPEVTPRVITLGAGFDTRSLRFAHIDGDTQSSPSTSNKIDVNSINRSLKADFYELDLPSVVSQKLNIFKRFLLRRPKSPLPSLYGADLNNLDEVKEQLSKIFADNKANNIGKERPTVFIIEAVLMYLKEENVLPLLSMCMSEAAKHSTSVNLCFADRLPGMPQGVTDADLGVEEEAAVKLFSTIGMDLKKWQPKPGRARHMGIAKYIMS
jgi:O-methyltransferase involved in polyketide biosynthesis